MISASCPSCGAPVTFAHPAAVSAVCPHCRSTVVRQGRDLATIGTIAPLGPEISVLRVGARGTFEGRGFTIAGALRKARERVRWTEWWLVFEDGETGWLSEGNGAWWIFAEKPRRLALGALPDALEPGRRFGIEGEAWRVVERAAATLTAAEGSLPAEVVGDSELRYADLRGPDGAVGTLDLEQDPPRLWIGVATDLAALAMQGTRPVAGWSDPVLVDFEGPTVSNARTLRCPACHAPLVLFTPAGAARAGCEHCGSLLDVEAEGDLARAKLVQRVEEDFRGAAIPLGARGVLEGVARQVVGSVVRAVRVDGVDYAWEELLLWNPWHGYAWLVRGVEGHWNLLRACAPPTELGGRGRVPRTLEHDGQVFRRFSHGHPKVRRVLGEFWWEIRVGDQVTGIDWVSPPRMISVEVTHDEESWSEGHWIPSNDVALAFGVPVPSPRGIGPTTPNPWGDPGLTWASRAGIAVGVLLGVLFLGFHGEHQEEVGAVHDGLQREMAPLSLAFRHEHALLAHDRLDVDVAAGEGHLFDGPGEAVVTVRHADGRTWSRRVDLCDDGSGRASFALPDGDYRVEARIEPESARFEVAGREARMRVTHAWDLAAAGLGVGALVALVVAFALLSMRAMFESSRWENADA